MPVSFQCGSCGKDFRVSRSLIGKKIRCKGCEGIMRVPEQSSVTNPPNAEPTIESPAPEPVPTTSSNPPDSTDANSGLASDWIVHCDDCDRQHRPDRKLIGKRIRCKCGSVIQLTDNPGNLMGLQPIDPALLGIEPEEPEPPPGAVSPYYQAPPPSFKDPPKTLVQERKRAAEEKVRLAEEEVEWRDQLKEDDLINNDDWGPTAKIGAGIGLIVAGAIWAFIAWKYDHRYSGSLWLAGVGFLSMMLGVFDYVFRK